MYNLKPSDVFASRYKLLEKLGVGGFSEVWKVVDQKAGNIEVALKIFAPGSGLDNESLEVFSREYSLVFNLNHPGLLIPKHFDDYSGLPYLVLPFCRNGSVQRLAGKFNETEIAKFIVEAASALEYLHRQSPPIIHLDIKPGNFLINETGNYLLTDFGISSKIRNTLTKSIRSQHESSGTTPYMAPERFSKKLEERCPVIANDIFSFGVTLFELLTAELPFGELGGIALSNGVEIPDLSEKFSPGLNHLIKSCLYKEAHLRINLSELIFAANNFLNTGSWPANEIEQAKGIRTTQKINIEKIPLVNETSDTKEQTLVTVEKQKKKKKYVLIGAIFLFLLTAVFVVKYIYDWNSQNEKKQSNENEIVNKGLTLDKPDKEEKDSLNKTNPIAISVSDTLTKKEETKVEKKEVKKEEIKEATTKIKFGANVTDYDGNVYKTVIIGTQTWMVENLKTTHYRDGTAIPNVTDNTAWKNLTTGAYCNYNNSAVNAITYGRLYNWYAVCNIKKLAPLGWHVPTDAEWITLELYLGMSQTEVEKKEKWRGANEGGKLKEAGTVYWSSPNTGATNSTLFTALPGGDRSSYDGTFESNTYFGFWWTSSESSTVNGWLRYLNCSIASIYRTTKSKMSGLSVRCVKDN